MRRLVTVARLSIMYLSALLLVAGYPVMAMADTPDAVVTAPTTTVPTPASTETPSAPSYTYNPASKTWDSTTWHFNGVTGKYEPIIPTPTIIVTPPTVTQTLDTTKMTDPVATTSMTAGSVVDATHKVKADTTSGNAAVVGNTTAGSAISGNTTASATILNNVNSVIAAGDNQKVANFTYNVMGNVNGDIMLYPMLLKTMLESQAATATNTITATQNNALTNSVDLNAKSGNALVNANTIAGDATTGSAHTVANVVNILNSMITANQSFIGTINIYGSLNGDILIAPDFIPQMIASNSQLQTSQTNTATAVTAKDTQAIVNNIALAAKTGSAAVLDNTSAGNATSGSSNTNVVIFNLSGHAVVAKDSLLVFVNVLGKWVGVIVNAPTGATSALIGNGVISDTSMKPDLKVTAQSTNAITNTITLNALSGDATVQGNTLAGNAKTGNATASANVANIMGSQLGLSHWFGVLFINVFNSWYGSFGINTSYGDQPMPTASPTPGVITFVPPAHKPATNPRTVTLITSGQLADATPTVDSAVLAAKDTSLTHTILTPSHDAVIGADYRWPIIIGSMSIIAGAALGLRWLLLGKTGLDLQQ